MVLCFEIDDVRKYVEYIIMGVVCGGYKMVVYVLLMVIYSDVYECEEVEIFLV